jgi:predicted membrane protein (TIGR00267 family)
MTILRSLISREHRLAMVMGFVDGILTAMLLAAARLLGRGTPLDLGIVVRVAVSALFTAGFVFYVGRYAELRGSLVRAAAQLNLARGGHLASTRLGQAVFREATFDAAVSGICSFAGALVPLSLGLLLPSAQLVILSFPILMLAVLGILLGRVVRGSALRWSLGLVLGGVLMTLIGFELHLV